MLPTIKVAGLENLLAVTFASKLQSLVLVDRSDLDLLLRILILSCSWLRNCSMD